MAKVKARVLSQFFDSGLAISPNSLVSGEKNVIEAMKDIGIVDNNSKAVAYCLGQEVIEVVGDGVDISAKRTAEEIKEDKKAADKKAAIEASTVKVTTLKEALETAPDADKKQAQDDLAAAEEELAALQA